jgi:hypothetical protein
MSATVSPCCIIPFLSSQCTTTLASDPPQPTLGRRCLSPCCLLRFPPSTCTTTTATDPPRPLPLLSPLQPPPHRHRRSSTNATTTTTIRVTTTSSLSCCSLRSQFAHALLSHRIHRTLTPAHRNNQFLVLEKTPKATRQGTTISSSATAGRISA